jgi:hypothetical protein
MRIGPKIPGKADRGIGGDIAPLAYNVAHTIARNADSRAQGPRRKAERLHEFFGKHLSGMSMLSAHAR